MDWLTKYWWVLVLVFLVGVMINVIKDRSPSIAKLAETPPMVGSVSTEIYGKPRSCIFASAAEVFAICISDISASCIRAPPEAEKQIDPLR